MSRQYATPLRLSFRCPIVLVALLCGGHLLALIAVWMIPAGVAVKLAMSCAVVAGVWRAGKRLLWPGYPDSIVALIWEDRIRCTLVTSAGDSIAAALQPYWYQQRLLTILHVKTAAGRRHTLVISRDRVASDEYRRLAVRLKISAAELAGAGRNPAVF